MLFKLGRIVVRVYSDRLPKSCNRLLDLDYYLRVRKLGSERKTFREIVRLDLDVAEMFPDTDAVNEVLRFLIRVACGR